LFDGTLTTFFAILAKTPPSFPVSATVKAPFLLASLMALITFFEFPLVLIPKTTSFSEQIA